MVTLLEERSMTSRDKKKDTNGDDAAHTWRRGVKQMPSAIHTIIQDV